MKVFQLAAGAILAALIVVAASYLSSAYVFWLACLAAISFYWPAAGVSILFLTVSVDFEAPLAGGIFVSYSELQFAVWAAASLLGFHDFCKLDWQPLKWGLPFLGAVLISSMIQLPFYKIPFHLLRISEIFVAAALALNVLKDRGPQSQRNLDLFRWSIAGAALFYSMTGLLQFALARETRIFSHFSNPNQFAGYLILLLPFALAFCFQAIGRRRWFWGYLSILVILSLSLTLSRSALLAAIISSGFILLVGTRTEGWRSNLHRVASYLKEHPSVAISHFVLVIGVIFWLTLSPITPKLLSDLETRHTGGLLSSFMNSRAPFFEIGLTIWGDHLWTGVGPGRYEDVLPEYGILIESYREEILEYENLAKWIPVHVHSLYIQLGVDFGILGLVTFLYFAGSGLGTLLGRVRRSPWALAGAAMLMAFLTHNLLDVTFPSLGLEIGLLLGASLGGSDWK